MSFRFGAIGAMMFALAMAGCASGGPPSPAPGAGEGAEGALADIDLDDLPQWMRDLPDGTPPRDDDHTQVATTQLILGIQSEDEESRQTYFERALAAALEGIEADPTNPLAHYLAGEAYLAVGNVEQAADHFDRAEEIYPRYVIETETTREEAWLESFNQGASLFADGQQAEAVPYFERAHRIYQGRPEAMLNLADAYSRRGDQDRSAEFYEQAIEVMTGPRSLDHEPEVLEQWDEYLEVARFNLAQIFFRQQRFAEAAEIYEALVERDPENLMALSNLAVAYMSSDQEEKATALYDQLLGRPDLDGRDYFLIGIGLYQAQDFEQSARAFKEAWDRVPNHREAALNYAQTLYLSDQWEELVGTWDRFVQLDRYNPILYQFQAYALSQLERQDEAMGVIDAREELPFVIDDVELMPTDQGVALMGSILNEGAEEGTAVRLRVTFYDPDGDRIGETETTVTLGGEGQVSQFQADLRTNDDVFGYRYEVM
jgi:tetratricopeptide (TPR) repeat protein